MPFLTIVEIISLTIKRRVNPEQARSLLRTGPKYAITGLKGARRATLFLLVRNFTQPLFLLLFPDKTPSSLASFLRFSVKTVNEITHLYMTQPNNKRPRERYEQTFHDERECRVLHISLSLLV